MWQFVKNPGLETLPRVDSHTKKVHNLTDDQYEELKALDSYKNWLQNGYGTWHDSQAYDIIWMSREDFEDFIGFVFAVNKPIAYDNDMSNVAGVVGGWTSYSGSDPVLADLLNNSVKVSQWGSGADIVLNGLTVGADYQVQMVLVGEWAGSSANLYVDGADYKYVYFGNATTDKVATYTFTAASNTVTMNCWRN